MSSKRKAARRRQLALLTALVVFCILALAVLLVLIFGGKHEKVPGPNGTQAPSFTAAPGQTEAVSDEPTEAPTDEPTAEPTKEPVVYGTIAPHDSAMASNYGFGTDLMVNGEKVSSFSADEPVTFDHNDTYQQIEGVLSFR